MKKRGMLITILVICLMNGFSGNSVYIGILAFEAIYMVCVLVGGKHK